MFFFMYVGEKNLLRQNNVRTSRQQLQPPRTVFILFLTKIESILGRKWEVPGPAESRVPACTDRLHTPGPGTGVPWWFQPAASRTPTNPPAGCEPSPKSRSCCQPWQGARGGTKLSKLSKVKRQEDEQKIIIKKNWAHSTRQRGDRGKKSSN